MKIKILLIIDALINLSLGILLLVFPPRVVEALGAPIPESNFYANILGAVLFGIGVALILECSRDKSGVVGLGVGGAISINICGAGVLALWLLFGDLEIPARGTVFLWSLAILILGISLIELFAMLKRRGAQQ